MNPLQVVSVAVVLLVSAGAQAHVPPGYTPPLLEAPIVYIQQLSQDPQKCERGSWSRQAGLRKKPRIHQPCPFLEVEGWGNSTLLRANERSLTVQSGGSGTLEHLAVPASFAIVDVAFARDSRNVLGLLRSSTEEATVEWAFDGAVWRMRTLQRSPFEGERKTAKVFASRRDRADRRRTELLREQGFQVEAKGTLPIEETVDGITVKGIRIGAPLLNGADADTWIAWRTPVPKWCFDAESLKSHKGVKASDEDCYGYGYDGGQRIVTFRSIGVLAARKRGSPDVIHAPLFVLHRGGAIPIDVPRQTALIVSQRQDLVLVLAGRTLQIFGAATGAELFRAQGVNFAYWEKEY